MNGEEKMLYRILTENVNYEQTIDLISARFYGFTVLTGMGYWQGKPEHSLIVEIVPPHGMGDGDARREIEKLAYAIKKQNGQQSVLVQRIVLFADFA
jgi:hypothetical protein